ncbi:hypothetical protein [Chryseobacterium limigenitum]|uniref:Uncharacterized protein n=1 Tax=Chryseobacterium limigenitum TaxID=1612149 RepID=A0A1K2IXJ9_9FLAO|nr:hypothetical protein [Chryseobacterium limigenitum]SFZ96920.1 hypothetical protein SAMN05216324_13014 [Chryseobacterium limigenitum]
MKKTLLAFLFLGAFTFANAQTELNYFSREGFSYFSPCIKNDFEDWGYNNDLGIFSANLQGNSDDSDNDMRDIEVWVCSSKNKQSQYIVKQKFQIHKNNYYGTEISYYDHKNGFRVLYDKDKYDDRSYNFVIYKEGSEHTHLVFGSIKAQSFNNFIKILSQFEFL